MEKTSEPRHHRGIVKRAWADLLVLRPAFALAAVWLTTAGHTASFREMNAARGWVTAEGYSLHSIYLLAITLTLLAAPRLARWSGSYPLVVAGLTMLGAGSLVNGVLPPRTAGAARARPRARRDRRGAGDPLGPAHPARRPGGPHRLGGYRATSGRAGRHCPRRGVVPLVVLAGRLSVRGRAGPFVARARALDRRPPRPRPGFPSGAGRTAGLPSRGRCGRTFGLVRDALGPAPRLARGTGHHCRDDCRVGRAQRASLDCLAGPRSRARCARGCLDWG